MRARYEAVLRSPAAWRLTDPPTPIAAIEIFDRFTRSPNPILRTQVCSHTPKHTEEYRVAILAAALLSAAASPASSVPAVPQSGADT